MQILSVLLIAEHLLLWCKLRVRVSAHLCHQHVCFQGWVSPAGGWNWSVRTCCGPPVDGPPSSSRSHTAGYPRAADARSALTGGRLHTHTHTHTKGGKKGQKISLYCTMLVMGVSESLFNTHLRALIQFICLLVPSKTLDNLQIHKDLHACTVSHISHMHIRMCIWTQNVAEVGN